MLRKEKMDFIKRSLLSVCYLLIAEFHFPRGQSIAEYHTLFGSAIGLPTDFWSFGGILAFLGVFGFDVTCVRLCRVVVAGPSSSSHP